MKSDQNEINRQATEKYKSLGWALFFSIFFYGVRVEFIINEYKWVLENQIEPSNFLI